MRRAFLLLLLCGCASAGTSPPTSDSTPKQAVIYTSPETGTLLGERPRASSIIIAAPPAGVWLAVKKVYGDWEIPLTIENTSTRQIGNANFYRVRQMAGESMAKFVDCGSGMTGPKALTYRIYISLLTDVIPDGKGGTRLQATFVAMGQDVAGGSTDRIPCGTTGRLEQLLLDRVASLAKP